MCISCGVITEAVIWKNSSIKWKALIWRKIISLSLLYYCTDAQPEGTVFFLQFDAHRTKHFPNEKMLLEVALQNVVLLAIVSYGWCESCRGRTGRGFRGFADTRELCRWIPGGNFAAACTGAVLASRKLEHELNPGFCNGRVANGVAFFFFNCFMLFFSVCE